ncbi:transglycosylase domain-containing protein [Naasia lichenicola]|nr:transglycosylase domain-containing protein [Naasia lichenicola]
MASRLGGFIGFVAVSAAAGVLATVAITPAIALTSMAATDTIGIFEDLPTYLEIGELSQRTNIYATNTDGSPVLLASFYDENRVEVAWDQISGYAKNAAVAGEDRRFYEHGGVDIMGTTRAILSNLRGNDVQGGSSITQQYVKNVRINNAIRGLTDPDEIDKAYEAEVAPSPSRKLREMRLAIGLEKKYTKDQILLGYLNIAGFGGRVYGIEAAANYYFNTTAANLTLAQAASLIAIVNNPEKFRLDYTGAEINGAADGYSQNKIRRDSIIDDMLDQDLITQTEHDEAVASPVTPDIHQASTGCASAPAGAGYFCDYITRIFQNDEFFGPDEDTRWSTFVRAGYDVYTTLDLDLQNTAQNAINEFVPKSADGIDIGSVAVSVQPGTGKILAMAQNKDYSADPEVLGSGANYSAVNYNTDEDYGGSSGFQPGSTYKMFTLTEWLKEGHGLNEVTDARKPATDWGAFRDSCNGGTVYFPGYNPNNDELDNGQFATALDNTMTSRNTGFMAMAKQLDLCEIRKTAESMGAHRANLLRNTDSESPEYGQLILDADGKTQYAPLEQGAGSVLGTNEIAPLTMAAAFATVAANGMYCKPIAIERIVAADGTEVPVPPSECSQNVDPKITAATEYALNKALTGGTGSPSYSRITTRVPMFSKTGTTDDAFATWMSGASSKVATTVGVFNASGFVNLRNIKFNGIQAATLRHNIWPRIMEVANQKYGGDAFPDPASELLRGQTSDIPSVTGLSYDQARSILQASGFNAQDGGQQDSNLPAGQVSGTNPTGEASKGAYITVYTSNGALKTVPDLVTPYNSVAGAAVAWTQAGFSAGNITPQCQVTPGGTGKPTAQSVAAGSAARADTAITLTYAKATCP